MTNATPNVKTPENDIVNHPKHYTDHPSGIEAIEVTEWMNFNLGNAMKYIWRADLKHDDGGIIDLEKAEWYVKREIERRKFAKAKQAAKEASIIVSGAITADQLRLNNDSPNTNVVVPSINIHPSNGLSTEEVEKIVRDASLFSQIAR